MNNIQRVAMETKGVELSQEEMIIYLSENGLKPHEEYNADSPSAKRAIYKTAPGVLESIANNPEMMRDIKLDDMTASDFHESLLSRIDQLERKIRTMRTDNNQSDFFMLFR